jgi:hypothetical protein
LIFSKPGCDNFDFFKLFSHAVFHIRLLRHSAFQYNASTIPEYAGPAGKTGTRKFRVPADAGFSQKKQ